MSNPLQCAMKDLLFAVDVELEADFEQNEHLGDKQMPEAMEFDIVACMFAIHYFFVDEATLKCFLSNVASNLKPGKVHACGGRYLCMVTPGYFLDTASLLSWHSRPFCIVQVSTLVGLSVVDNMQLYNRCQHLPGDLVNAPTLPLQVATFWGQCLMASVLQLISRIRTVLMHPS